ncbi:MAG: hypothetical protein KDK78_01840, partial [Chlamydiia bacterium]|nr:hypothetical protein [Chlamydiia bacterium]
LAAVLKRRLVLSAIIPAFDSYYAALDQALFEESRLLKDEASAGKLDSEAGRATVEFWLEERRHETQMLKFLVYRVREFFLRNDPNPYVHTRMGWHDRPLGPEPKQTAPLSRLRRSLRRLDGLFHRLSEAVHEFERSKSDAKWQRNILVVGELYEGINELSQLESKEEALQHVDELMSCWRQIDEVCSFHSEDVSYDEFLLRKALLNDRFFVLVKHQAFQDMYRMHIAIRGPFREQSQREKITRIQAVLRQWRNSAEQVGEVLTESNAFLDGLWRTSESSDTAEFEEARRQFLEFLNSYHRFELFAQRIVVPRSIDRQWTEVNQRIHDLDHRFFLIEQQSLLALRVG